MVYGQSLEEINPELFIFASRHVSEASRPSFLIHATGNWDVNADFGGSPNDLSNTSALLLKAGFVSLTENAKSTQLSDFMVNVEVTHHGPTVLKKPLVFMELGSSKKEWEKGWLFEVYGNGDGSGNGNVMKAFKAAMGYLNTPGRIRTERGDRSFRPRNSRGRVYEG